MNPDATFWLQLFARLAVTGSVLLGLAALAARWGRSAAWPRTVWQAGLVALLLLLGFALTGASQGLWPQRKVQKEFPQSALKVIATVGPLGTPVPPVVSASPPNRASSPDARASAWDATWGPGLLWLAGVGTLLVRGGIARAWLRWRGRNRTRLTDGLLRNRAEALARRLGLRTARLVEAAALPGPFAYGLIRPTVCLPKHFACDFTPAQQEAMLAHELAHVAARDPAWGAVADVVVALWWWHPLVWWARRQLREASERAADEASLLLEDGPGVLAECLVALGRRLAQGRESAVIGVGGTGLKSGLARRVARLLALNRQPVRAVVCRRTGLRRLTTLGLFAVLGTVASAWPDGQSERARRGADGWQTSLAGRAWHAIQSTVPIQLMAQADGLAQEAPASPPPPIQIDSGANNESNALRTRAFQLGPGSLRQYLNTVASGHDQARSTNDLSLDDQVKRLRALLKEAGVDFTHPGKALFWNERNGHLLVRATAEDLVMVEQFVSLLGISPPQITIDVKFAEIDDNDADAPAFYKLIGLAPDPSLTPPTAVPPREAAPRDVINGSVRLQSPSNAAPPVITGVLKPSQFSIVLRALEQRRGVNVLSSPKVTTQSDRQAQIKVVNVRYVVTDLDRSNTGAPQPIAEPMEFGPVLDVVPNVQPDGKTIHLTVIPTVKEFLGYDLETGQRFDPQNPFPLPIFRLRQAVASAVVRDGQTVVLSPGTVEVESKSDDPNTPGTKTRKTLLIFVTPTIIDPAGNRVNSPEELDQEAAAPAPVRAIPRR